MGHFPRGLEKHLSAALRHAISPLQKTPLISHYRSMATESPTEMQYQPPRFENVEDVEKYRPGGLHPVRIGDYFKHKRYRVLHKLGFGGFSTVWLARDEHQNRLVSLKLLTAAASRKSSELDLLKQLGERCREKVCRPNLVTNLDDFTLEGPNGTHVCYVSQVGGPSLSAISDSPGEMIGTRRIRAPLARRLASQLASVVSLMHDSDVVHGDITPKNVLLQLNGFDALSTEEIYRQLGYPTKANLVKLSGEKPGPSAPEYVVESASFSHVGPKYISGQALLIDLGEAFLAPSPPPNGLGTPVSYCSPELIMERKASKVSDIWALACTVFEMRSGFPLFESFVRSHEEILDEMVRILGLPKDSSHPLWEKAMAGENIQASSLGERMREIGMYDQDACRTDDNDNSSDQLVVLEPLGKRISEEEVGDLANLLQRALDYVPEQRFSAREMTNHLWFTGSR